MQDIEENKADAETTFTRKPTKQTRPQVSDDTRDGEVWRAVVNPKNSQYMVSNLGRVSRRGVILRASLNTGGYAKVSLWCGGVKFERQVHRLVADAFLGIGRGRTVNHRDGNKLNNAASNLEWLSRAANIRHGWRTGLYAKAGFGVSPRYSGAMAAGGVQ